MRENRRPRLCNSRITRVSKVVLPAPLHPARPITFIAFSAVLARTGLGILQTSFISADSHCHANLPDMMKIEKAPAPLIVPNLAYPRLTERVAGTDQIGAAVVVRVP